MPARHFDRFAPVRPAVGEAAYSQYSSGSLASMARMFVRVHSPQWYSTPRSPNPNDHPSGRPLSAASEVVPHRQHTRVTDRSVDVRTWLRR